MSNSNAVLMQAIGMHLSNIAAYAAMYDGLSFADDKSSVQAIRVRIEHAQQEAMKALAELVAQS